MRLSRLFPRSLHQAPGEAEQAGHRLLLRAGLLRSLGAGRWAWLPLGEKVRAAIGGLAGEALARLGAQSFSLPPLAPTLGDLALENDMPVQALLELLRPDLRSHRQLPLLLCGFRARVGEELSGSTPLSTHSLVLEVFSFQPNAEAMAAAGRDLAHFCTELLQCCGLAPVAAEAGLDRQSPAVALIDPRVPGDDSFVRCSHCGYQAGLHAARRAKEVPPPEPLRPLEKVSTPGCHTIAELATFLDIPESRTAKAVLLVGDDRFFFVVIRGDMELDLAKLAGHLGVGMLRPAQHTHGTLRPAQHTHGTLRPALEHEIRAIGASPGYASPVGIRRSAPEAGLREVQVVVDDLVPLSPNLVAGANEDDVHLLNVNYGRDYSADLVADLAAVRPGDPCPECGEPLEFFDSTVLAHYWAPGRRPAEELGATFQDAAGQEQPFYLACAQVEVDRLPAACVEVHHDEAGIRWPVALAPYDVQLLALGESPEVMEAATSLYDSLRSAGIGVLFDDRPESAGFKFADADLLGMPLRIAVSKRTLQQQSVEAKRRDRPREAVQLVPLDAVGDWIEDSLHAMLEVGGNDA